MLISQYRLSDKYGIRFQRKSPTGATLSMNESDLARAYDSLLASAIDHFTNQKAEVNSLPPDSKERATIEMALGILTQARASEKGTPAAIRASVEGLMAMKPLLDGYDPEAPMYRVISQILQNASDTLIQATEYGDDEDIDDTPPDEAPPAEGNMDDPPEEEEDAEDGNSDLSLEKGLGLV